MIAIVMFPSSLVLKLPKLVPLLFFLAIACKVYSQVHDYSCRYFYCIFGFVDIYGYFVENTHRTRLEHQYDRAIS